MPPLLASLVACLAVLLALVLGAMVGRARQRYNVPAPATTGHPEFEKLQRVHANTVEQLVLFLPPLLIFGAVVDSKIAALLGLVWIGGRLHYARSYLRDPATRLPGMFVTLGATAILLVGSIIGIVVTGIGWL
jgi:glutathione S-transferase